MEDGERSLVDDSPIPFFFFFLKNDVFVCVGKNGRDER